MTRDYSRKPDVEHWLPRVLKNEVWYGNDCPRWEHCELSDQASEKRQSLIKALRRRPKDPSLKWLITRLKDCRPNARCYSGSCPECNRALQRFFANHIASIRSPMECASLVMETVAPNALDTFSVRAFQARMKRLLLGSGVALACGGIDYSFNTDADPEQAEHWAPQLWLFIPSKGRVAWEQTLRTACRPSVIIPRPLMTLPFDGDLRAAAYAIKSNFNRRHRYIADNGRANTRCLRLPNTQKKQLAKHLDDQGLGSRLFLLRQTINTAFDPPRIVPRETVTRYSKPDH